MFHWWDRGGLFPLLLFLAYASLKLLVESIRVSVHPNQNVSGCTSSRKEIFNS